MVIITPTILEATWNTEKCVVKFTESGYEVISDDRKVKVGYLHVCEGSTEEITDACRDQIIQYMFNHPQDLPGIGMTTIERYFAGLSIADLERIGNFGRIGFYN